ncbi:Protein kinase domain protein [Theileria parva strain Muguga]|uniref:Calcium-dependent protein kinase 1 n=1 Tax=Theileria parva TaxID=5875 RepID=Q4N737_THEPA|nr:Protein kinase domain protein [Theileria parva strain Muguga]EAN34221.1 Protein kinase domain protein [Theileria parva strain Muguga]|eukprot:XP_766504.1 calcium-dependent protein kinase [Theileria parva strain Muguga]
MGCKCSRPRGLDSPHLKHKPGSGDTEDPLSFESDIKLKPSMYIGNIKDEFNSLYTVCRKLGTGAYGTVFLCTRINSTKEYAVKVIKKLRSSSIDSSQGRLREVKYLKELDHPNIARLYDVYEDSVAYYIVMEPCYGGELFDEIIKRQRITEHESACLIKQILSGVCYLHKNNIVHRDLKPENLLLEKPGSLDRIKIVDFGLSAHFGNHVLKERLGTVYYIAPEVLNRNYHEKCDVWSCGIILYILLCGYPPFTSPNDSDIIRMIIAGKYTFPDKEWRDVSEDAKNLIDLMLTYDPKKRISAAQALNHPWVLKYSNAGRETAPTRSMSLALQNLKTFTKTQKLAQAVMLLMANKFTTNDEINELSKLFSQLDTNGDGALDRSELIQGYKSIKQNLRDGCSRMSNEEIEKEVDEIIRSCDLDHSGSIDYSEFITGCIDKLTLLSKERLKLAFSTFDVDGSGKISNSELSQILGVSNAPNLFNQILNEIDTNHDGEIDFEEFERMLDKITLG